MRPTKRLFWFAIGWTLLGLAAALNNWLPGPWSQPDWQPQLEKIWQISSATLVFLLLFDGIMVRRTPLPTRPLTTPCRPLPYPTFTRRSPPSPTSTLISLPSPMCMR